MSDLKIHNIGFTSSNWDIFYEKDDFENVEKSPRNKKLADECSIGKDEDGYFAYTHRARTKSYPKQDDIPKTRIKFINSTG